MRGAVLGAVVLEGWADSAAEAERLVAEGGIDLAPCHHQGAVGPMAGIISPSMPVFVVENKAAGNRAYCSFNEGLGKVLRFGANGPAVIARLRMMAGVVAPTLGAVLARTGAIELKPLMAQALNMGDEVHNRNAAATALFIKRIAPALIETDVVRADAAATLGFIAGNDHFFLNLSMAACKAMCDAAAGVAGSSMVTAMARNGVTFGVRLSGTGDTWFEAPANPVDGLLSPTLIAMPRPTSRFGHHRDRRRRRLRDGAAPATPNLRRRHVGRRHPPQPAHARHHAWHQSVIHAARARLRGDRRRHRRAQGRRLRRAADHQQRHRSPRRRRRPDRRRRHHGADGVLRGGGESARAQRRTTGSISIKASSRPEPAVPEV
jgi:hypothetical protein